MNDGAGDAAISGDGRYVAFTTRATNVLPGQRKHQNDLFVQDRWTGRTELVTAGDGTSGAGDDQSIRSAYDPAVDAFGTTLLFTADDGNLVPGDTNGCADVFRRRL
ncbi:hypothetical protein [Kitasatospora sp. NPDC054795]